jgi:ubiquinone/menaquinone biosynthesis C-methylase UbiE
MDAWKIGQSYEPYVGRWSRLVARSFVEWVAVGEDGRWVDVGCGTGALTDTIVALARPASVVGVDSSEGFVALARQTLRERAHLVRFEVADARSLPCEEATCDAAVSGLVLNFLPEPRAMV